MTREATREQPDRKQDHPALDGEEGAPSPGAQQELRKRHVTLPEIPPSRERHSLLLLLPVFFSASCWLKLVREMYPERFVLTSEESEQRRRKGGA